MFAEVRIKPEMEWLSLGDNVQGTVCSLSTVLNVDVNWTPPISERLVSISTVAFGFYPS